MLLWCLDIERSFTQTLVASTPLRAARLDKPIGIDVTLPFHDVVAVICPQTFARDPFLGEVTSLVNCRGQGLMLLLQDHGVDKKLPLFISPFPAISITSAMIPPVPSLGHYGICISWKHRKSSTSGRALY